jgi:hypothetical protein
VVQALEAERSTSHAGAMHALEAGGPFLVHVVHSLKAVASTCPAGQTLRLQPGLSKDYRS